MKRRPAVRAVPPGSGTSIIGCTISSVGAAANDHSRAMIEALANAAKANAEAITAIAHSCGTIGGRFGPCIVVGKE